MNQLKEPEGERNRTPVVIIKRAEDCGPASFLCVILPFDSYNEDGF